MGAGKATSQTRGNGSTWRQYKRSTAKGGAPAPKLSLDLKPIKKKIRDLSQLLETSPDMTADVRVENERALAGYKQDLSAAKNHQRNNKMISKYHMVRFFGELRA